MRVRRLIGNLACVFAVTLLWVPTVKAQNLPAKARTLLVFKSLTFDRNLAKGREMLRMGVLALKGDKTSETDAHQMKKEIRKVKHMKVRGLAITVDAIYAKNGKAAVKAINNRKVNLIYLTRKTESLMDEICKRASVGGLLVVSGEQKTCSRCAAVAVVAKDNKPLIMVNKEAAKAQGANFSKRLLKLSKPCR